MFLPCGSRASSSPIPCSRTHDGGRNRARLRPPSFFVAAALALLAAGCASTPPENPDNACAIFADKRGWWDGVRDAERRWDIPPHVTLAIIRQESSFDADAKPARGRFLFVFPGARPSSAYGYAQVLDSTWEEYLKETGRRFSSRDDFDDAADFIGWYAAKSKKLAGVKMDDARNQYLAYHEGQGGFTRGTYRSKPWLMDVAAKVDRNAETYRRQLKSCRRKLDRRFLIF